ncbi:MAG: ferritin, partial [Rhodoferax sp.]|nr:ferritin [Rhodoferax sp.]
RILHNTSLLMDRSFKTVQELNRYRKEISKEVAGGLAPPAEGASA